jgi:undecaprenyl-diphosphatase
MSRIAAAILVGALLAPIAHLDEMVQRAVQSRRSPALDRVMRTLTDLGRRDITAYGLLAIAILDGGAGVATARLAVGALIPTSLAVEGLKRAVGRVRPDGTSDRANSSFPSSHAAGATALAWILSRRWRRLRVGFWLLATAVCLSRIYLNRHFLSDVLGGVAVGLVCTWVVLRLWPSRWLGPALRS